MAGRNREQERAAAAYAAVDTSRQVPGFLDLCVKLPSMLQTNGLLASAAYLLKRNDEAREAVRRALFGHLRANASGTRLAALIPASNNAAQHAAAFARWCDAQQGLSGQELRDLTGEALRLSAWLKRAAEAAG